MHTGSQNGVVQESMALEEISDINTDVYVNMQCTLFPNPPLKFKTTIAPPPVSKHEFDVYCSVVEP